MRAARALVGPTRRNSNTTLLATGSGPARDAITAREIIKSDTEINDLYNHTFHRLIELMVTEPATATRDARLLFVAKHLERIGDYVTDICELTVYMAEAAFIKHTN